MRNYSKVRPKFWVGETARELRGAGPEALLVALHLMSCPNSNMIGVYHLPITFLSHLTALTPQGASKALARVCEGGFATYDEASEHVFVHRMAAEQIGETLAPKDNQWKGVLNELSDVRNCRLALHFYKRYAVPYQLPSAESLGLLESPSEGPPKPLRSQEQEQEQEQEQRDLVGVGTPTPPPSVVKSNDIAKQTRARQAGELGEAVLAYLAAKAGRGGPPLKLNDARKKRIAKLHADGWRYEDFTAVIWLRTQGPPNLRWLNDPKMDQYVRFETLFGTEKAEANRELARHEYALFNPERARALGWVTAPPDHGNEPESSNGAPAHA